MTTILSINSNTDNFYPWTIKGNVSAVKGYVSIDQSNILKDMQLLEYITDRVNIDNSEEFISSLNGNFCFILDLGSHVIAATDLITSTPIFYKLHNNMLFIGDDYSCFLNSNANLDRLAVNQFLISGYCYDHHTLIDGVYQLPAGSILKYCKSSKNISTSSYYNYIPDIEPLSLNTSKSNDQLVDELHTIHLKVFENLVKGLEGRRAIIPLTAGYDSRLILEMLLHFNYKNILCVTWGKPWDWEVQIAKNVAQSLEVEWRLINSTRREWQDWYNKSFEDEMHRVGALAAIPYIQEQILIDRLETEGVIKKGDVFLSGNSGDFIEGEHIPQQPKVLNKDTIIEIIRKKHQNLNILEFEEYEEINKHLEQSISHYSQKTNNNLMYFFEYWEWKERQSKFVTNCIKPFEYNGYDWRMPLWDKQIMDYWRNIPFNVKYNRSLFYYYANKYMEKGIARANPKVSAIARYSRRLLDPRFGCYSDINPSTYFSTDKSKVFPEYKFNTLSKQPLIYYKLNSLLAMDIISRTNSLTKMN